MKNHNIFRIYEVMAFPSKGESTGSAATPGIEGVRLKCNVVYTYLFLQVPSIALRALSPSREKAIVSYIFK